MQEYEIVVTYCNGCAGSAHPQISFEEAELNDPAEYIRMKHSKDFSRFVKEIPETGKTVFKFDNGFLSYTYEFTKL